MKNEFELKMSAAKLRKLSEAVNTLSKTRDMDDLSKVGDALAKLYSDMLGIEVVLKIGRK
jgi:hypothetical protein